MNAIAWSQNLTAEKAAAQGVTAVSKEALFREADFITIHLRLSDRSRGLVNAEMLALMKPDAWRSEEHTSELQSLMRISYAVFCLKKKKEKTDQTHRHTSDNKTHYFTSHIKAPTRSHPLQEPYSVN